MPRLLNVSTERTMRASRLTDWNADHVYGTEDVHHLLVNGADDVREGQCERTRTQVSTARPAIRLPGDFTHFRYSSRPRPKHFPSHGYE